MLALAMIRLLTSMEARTPESTIATRTPPPVSPYCWKAVPARLDATVNSSHLVVETSSEQRVT